MFELQQGHHSTVKSLGGNRVSRQFPTTRMTAEGTEKVQSTTGTAYLRDISFSRLSLLETCNSQNYFSLEIVTKKRILVLPDRPAVLEP